MKSLKDLKPPMRSHLNQSTYETYSVPYRWVPIKSDKIEEVFKDIVEALFSTHLTFENINDLLNQTDTIVWTQIPDPENTLIYKHLKDHGERLNWYHGRRISKKRKAEILKDVRDELILTLENYSMNE